MFFPPARSWQQIAAIDPEREYLAFTSRFFMKSPWRVLSFLSHTRAVEKQIAAAPGIVGWSLAANIFKLEFYTLSAWQDAESLHRFTREAEHGGAMQEFEHDMRRDSLLIHYHVKGADLPLSWKDAVRRQNGAAPEAEP